MKVHCLAICGALSWRYFKCTLTNTNANSIKTVKKQYLAAASLLIVFIIDIFAPQGLGVDILYLSSILLVSEQDTRTIVGFTILACVFILIDEDIFMIKSAQADTALEWANRLISIFAILMTSLIAVRYQKSKVERLKKEKRYINDLKEMMYMTSHEVRKPLANILGLIDIMLRLRN